MFSASCSYLKRRQRIKGDVNVKQSYKIIISLAVVFVLGISGLLFYEYNNTQVGRQDPVVPVEDGEEASEETPGIIPFAPIFEADGVLYSTRSNPEVEDAEIIPVRSQCFAVIGEDVYYITEGDEEFAPELRRCGVDGNNDISVTEFMSPLGAPISVGDYIYSAYYTDVDDGMNNGIYRYDIGKGITEKAIEGEYFIYGYDNEYIYYSTNSTESSGTVLYRMDFNGENNTQVLNYPVVTDSIVIGDDYIFFSAYDDISHCYKIYRSPKSGNGNIDEYVFMCMSEFFDVTDGRIYYQASNAIYSSEINGDDEVKVADLEEGSSYAYGFLKFDDILYFREHSEAGETLYRVDLTTGEKKVQS